MVFGDCGEHDKQVTLRDLAALPSLEQPVTVLPSAKFLSSVLEDFKSERTGIPTLYVVTRICCVWLAGSCSFGLRMLLSDIGAAEGCPVARHQHPVLPHAAIPPRSVRRAVVVAPPGSV
jgi:hypothetical protein